MLTSWLTLPGATDRVDRWSESTGLDLIRLGTTADAGELRDTAVAQPLLTAAALLSGRALTDAGVVPDVISGHSIGELPALALADVIDDDAAVALAAGRGAAMARAAALTPTGMAAVLGGDRDEVLAAGAGHGLSLATANVAGQVVLGGPVTGIQALAADPPAGARVRLLDVAGAFHTAAMASAADDLAGLVAGLTARTPQAAVVANADGVVVDDGDALLGRLVGQLTGPVRFDLCLQTIAGLAPTAVIELAPGGTLAGLAKRALAGIPLVALKTVDDLDAAHQLVAVPA